MSKKIWLRGSNYGGEMTIGEVTKEFVEYWQPICKEEGDSRLIDHLMALEAWDSDPQDEEGYDPDSPAIYEDDQHWNNWYECDEIHHQSTSSGTELWAFEMSETEEGYPDYDWDTQVEFEPHQLYSREVYTQDEEHTDHEQDNSLPVLVFYSSEKGDFGGWCVELADGEEFDKNKVAVSIVETDHGEMIERLWYDKKELDQEYDWCDSRGKGYYAGVAYFNTRWEDPALEEGSEYWDEVWSYYDEDLEEKSKA